MLFEHIQFRFEDDPKPVCQKYSHAKINLPQETLAFKFTTYSFYRNLDLNLILKLSNDKFNQSKGI